MQINTPKQNNPLDLEQKDNIVRALSDLLDNPYAKEAIGWNTDRLLAPCVEDASFDQNHRSARLSLSILLQHPGLAAIREQRNIPSNAIFLVDENARLFYSHQNLLGSGDERGITYVSPRDITADVTALSDFAKELTLLADMAKLNGGWVLTGDFMLVSQWLRLQGLALAKDEIQIRELLDLINFSQLPDAPKYANYWQLLDAPEDSAFKLDDEQREIIRQVTEELTGGETSLVAHFGVHLMLEATSADQLSTSTEYRLRRLIETAVWSSENAKDYIDALGWFPQEHDAKPSPALVEQLLIAVMLLDLAPSVTATDTHFAGFDLYAKDFNQRAPAYVRTALEKHLIESLNLHEIFAPLVAELVLGGMAPEYAYRAWPSEIRMGTPAWVLATQALHLAETLEPGVSRNMTYPHLMGLGHSAKATPELAELQAARSLDPVVTWASMNALITRDANNQFSKDAIQSAAKQYEHQLNKILSGAETFARPLPDRKPLALTNLLKEVPGCDPDELLVKHRGSGGGAGRKVSVLDLYMGDELHTQDWDRPRGESIYDSFPRLARLFPVAEIYDSAVSDAFNRIVSALANNIQLTLSQLNADDAPRLEYGAMGVYGVQKADYRAPQVSSRPGVVIPGAYVAGDTGRYGVVLCVQFTDNQVACFELFPLKLQCRYNPKLEAVFGQLVSGDYNERTTRFSQKAEFKAAPIDTNAYFQNVDPEADGKSHVFVRKIGEFEGRTVEADPSTPAPYFSSTRKEQLSLMVAREIPYITQSEMHKLGFDQTDRERAIEKTDAALTAVLNLIVPFKACVEGLLSDDARKQAEALVSCVNDAMSLGLSFLTLPTKVALSVGNAATVSSRLLNVQRVLVSALISLFNPLGGLPQVLFHGGKLLSRNVLRLGARTLGKARQQVRYLSGANRYDLVKALEKSGVAGQIRMSLDTVAHGRAIFKSDLIENAGQVLQRLHVNDTKVLAKIPEQELTQLLEKSLTDIARQSGAAQSLKKLMEPKVVDSLIRQQAQKYSLANLHQFKDPATLPELFETTLQVELKNLTYMRGHQDGLLTKDLSKAPFNNVLDEVTFNPGGLTDNTDRATAWILMASNSRNESGNIKNLLLEYVANQKPLNDATLLADLHKRIAPNAIGGLRSPTGEARYPSNVSGAALLEKHVATLDVASEHFSKQMLGAMLGYHSFVDGNGRTARAIYAIAQLRKGQFTPLGKATENALSGLS